MINKRYVKQLNMELSPLGEGIMRFNSTNGRYPDEAFRFIESAVSDGINYFDTAYNYTGSEEFVRQALAEKYPRNAFVIADKLPVWLCGSRKDMDDIFNEQLERLGVDFIDIYLLHSMNKERWMNVYDYGVLDFLDEKKREGRIHKTGFSFHDSAVNIPVIADSYDWDIVQLQINYYDWIVHDIKQAYEYIHNKRIPIVVMEPVGGGRLARLPDDAEKVLKAYNPAASTPSWAIRFCASLPGVEVVLSGMTTQEELNDNISSFSPMVPLTEHELTLLEDAVRSIQNAGAIPCSACRYCTGACPVHIDIPYIFQQYNDYRMYRRPLGWTYMDLTPPERRVDKCINCNRCADICPQKIDVPGQLLMVHNLTEKMIKNPGYEALITVFHSEDNIDRLPDDIKEKRIILFGAGAMGKSILAYLKERDITVSYICDNGSHLWNTEIEGIKVISPDELKEKYNENETCVIIANQSAHDRIETQLAQMGIIPLNKRKGA